MATAVSDLECRDRNQENQDFHKQWLGGNAIKLKSASKMAVHRWKLKSQQHLKRRTTGLAVASKKSQSKKVWSSSECFEARSSRLLYCLSFLFLQLRMRHCSLQPQPPPFFPRLKNVICFATNMTFVPFNFLYETFI